MNTITKYTILSVLTAGLTASSFGAQKTDPPSGRPGETVQQRDARMAWWREARFGMFIFNEMMIRT